MNLKPVKCNLCGENRPKPLATCKIGKADADLPIGSMGIVRCANCGLVYASPRPEYLSEEFNDLYSEKYFNAPYMRFYIEKEGGQTNEPFEFRLDWLEKFKRKGRILDIGCASGNFLKTARDRGWDTYGVEVSKTATDIATKKYGLNVITGRLNETAFNNDFFDVVTVSDVLEHVEDPQSFLLEINRIMKKDGLLYIAVPDFDGLYYKIAILIARFNHRNYFVLPHHIYFFNKDSISRYLKKTNFELLDFKKSEANISTSGFIGRLMQLLFYIARRINKQDRIIFLANKR